ncbi:group III truncated hemoglobin [Pedobacter sp. PWIIR3]
MRKDIIEKADIILLVEDFYSTVLTDESIGDIFVKANFNLETHIPVMVSFWQGILLNEHHYHGNPMVKHIELNRLVPLKGEHFKRWLEIWRETVLKNFSGTVADNAIKRADNIAQIMMNKLNQLN